MSRCAFAAVVAVGAGAPAAAATLPTRDAGVLAGAMSAESSLVTGASFVTIPPGGTPTAVSTTRSVRFPQTGGSYAILSTGNTTNLFGRYGTNLATDLGGASVRGNTDFDVTIVKIDLAVPAGRNCMSFNVRLLSEEFPEFPGKIFNDAFLAELDVTDWTTVGSRVIAPHDFALRTNTRAYNGTPLNIRTTGEISATRSNAGTTRFDGATPLLRASTPITPGAHSLYLSLFDQGDHIYDSAAFLDGLRTFASATTCPIGVVPSVRPTIRALRTTVGVGGHRVFRAGVSSESSISAVSARLDGRLVYVRRAAPGELRVLTVRVPVDLKALKPGRHLFQVSTLNRAGRTTFEEAFTGGSLSGRGTTGPCGTGASTKPTQGRSRPTQC
ncbi:MAG: choice-of-anchor L domain-containing protein [Solirubrobacteraceae bacterium]